MAMFYLTDTNEVRKIEAKAWTGHGLGPDIFSEIAAEQLANADWDPQGGFYRMTKAEFTEMTEWWEREFGLWVEGKTSTGEQRRPIDVYLIIETTEQ